MSRGVKGEGSQLVLKGRDGMLEILAMSLETLALPLRVIVVRRARRKREAAQTEENHPTGNATPPAQPSLDHAGMRSHDLHLLFQGFDGFCRNFYLRRFEV